MFYLSLGFGVVWACYFAYLYVVDRQVRQLHRRLDAAHERLRPIIRESRTGYCGDPVLSIASMASSRPSIVCSVASTSTGTPNWINSFEVTGPTEATWRR